MNIGEKIRSLRQKQGLTIRQLGDKVGVNESYIRAYETGLRHPKASSMQRLADALDVNVEVLKNCDTTSISAMQHLFQMYRSFGGVLFQADDDNGNSCVAIRFHSLPLMQSWYQRYEQYEQEVREAMKIQNLHDRNTAIQKANESFDLWMDRYPLTEPNPSLLQEQEEHDKKIH